MKLRINKKLKWLVFRLTTYYLLLLMALYCFQSKLLYYPFETKNTYVQWQRVNNSDGKIIAIEQKRVAGLENPEKSGKLDKAEGKLEGGGENILIIFHGNAGSANDRIGYKAIFPNSHLVIAEYPGFGMRYGQEFGKDKIIKEARGLVEQIKKDNPGAKISILGESLGTGVASAIAQESGIDKLILVTPYTNIADVAQHRFWFFPVKYLVKDNYDNLENMKSFKGRVMIVLAERDEVVPTKFGQALYDSMDGTTLKTQIIVRGSTHNSWIIDIKAQELKIMRDFVN